MIAKIPDLGKEIIKVESIVIVQQLRKAIVSSLAPKGCQYIE